MSAEWLVCICGQEVSCYHGSCLDLMSPSEQEAFHAQRSEQAAWNARKAGVR